MDTYTISNLEHARGFYLSTLFRLHLLRKHLASPISCSEMNGDKILQTSTTPPFLFRVASHLSRGVDRSVKTPEPARFLKPTVSRGINTAEVIDPLDGYGTEYHSSLAEIELRDLRHMLKNHVNYENKVASEFSSWSVSLLYVLVHAIRKKYNEKNGLLIYVMDTTQLSPSRIFHSRQLLRACDLQATPNLMDYALGRYTSHSCLPDRLTSGDRRILNPRQTSQYGLSLEGSASGHLD